jgi:hypothetical protein
MSACTTRKTPKPTIYATMAVEIAPTNISALGHPMTKGDMALYVSEILREKIHPWSVIPVGLGTSPIRTPMI